MDFKSVLIVQERGSLERQIYNILFEQISCVSMKQTSFSIHFMFVSVIVKEIIILDIIYSIVKFYSAFFFLFLSKTLLLFFKYLLEFYLFYFFLNICNAMSISICSWQIKPVWHFFSSNSFYKKHFCYIYKNIICASYGIKSLGTNDVYLMILNGSFALIHKERFPIRIK